MRTYVTPGRKRRSIAVAATFLCIALTGCSPAESTPSAVPASPLVIVSGMPTETADTPTSGLSGGLATLPPTVPYHGKTIYEPPAGSSAQLIGIGPDDTLYVLLARSLVGSDVAASVIALGPDGSVRPGWPTAGVPISGYPTSYKVNSNGTVFVASGDNPYGGTTDPLSQLIVTAIGPGGKVLPGWPYRTPAARQGRDPNLLQPGPDDSVCFLGWKPGVTELGSDVPMVVYCLGANGALLPGWPYSSDAPLWNLAVGPDGSVYVGQKTSSKISATWYYVYPYQVLAIGHDGRLRTGWTPWVPASHVGITVIMPTSDGRVRILLGGDGGNADLALVDSTGKTVDDHAELASIVTSPNYKDAVALSDGSLFVSLTEQTGQGDFVNAYEPDGSQMVGWPQPIGGWGDIAVSPRGDVWAEWVAYGPAGSSGGSFVALFDRSGKLQPGYPMASDRLSASGMAFGLGVTSDGTAYATANTALGSKIVAFRR